MEENKMAFKSINEFILQYPPEVQEILSMLRKVIKIDAPKEQLLQNGTVRHNGACGVI